MDPSLMRADCESCFGLCCVLTAFGESDEFAFSRGPGTVCINLNDQYRCNIHGDLQAKGMAGCTRFDCFGAGPRISNVTFSGRSWRESNKTRTQMILAFSVMRALHELIWYIDDALSFTEGPFLSDLKMASKHVENLAEGDASSMYRFGADAERKAIDPLLHEASRLARADCTGAADFANEDLTGRSFVDADLTGTHFTNTVLNRADLHGANMMRCDMLGAKLKDADIRSTDLSSAIYLTQMQVNSANGDASTRLPHRIIRPGHWPT